MSSKTMTDGQQLTESPHASENGEDITAKFQRLCNSVDDFKQFILTRIHDVDEKTDENAEAIAELEGKMHELEQRVESMAGLAEDERSTPAKRAADLREAMLRAAGDSRGVKWWKDEVASHLKTLGHENLHKPDYYDAMERVAEYPGFTHDGVTKTVTKDGRTWDAKAVKVDLEDVPGHGGDQR